MFLANFFLVALDMEKLLWERSKCVLKEAQFLKGKV